ncbi:MAG TPA: hypothetical protein VH372_03905 [Actinospica sp.]|nr:hypothetical protein [Actinospica sp.]
MTSATRGFVHGREASAGQHDALRMITLRMIADKDYLALARTSAMHVGALLAFPLARVSDLRLAVDEACISFLDPPAYRDPDLPYAACVPSGTLELAYDRHASDLHVTVTGTAPAGWPERQEPGWAILEALVGEVRAEVRAGDGVLTLIEPLPTG